MSPRGALHQPPAAPDEGGPAAAAGSGSRLGRLRLSKKRRLALAGGLVALVLVAVGALVLTRDDAPPPLDAAGAQTIATGVVKKAIEDLRSQPATSAKVYQQILPSLVQIETESSGAENDGNGLGAGVIVNRTGAILTALHVVQGAEKVQVSFVDGTRSPAMIVSADPENDIAVLAPQQGPEVIVPAVLGGAGQVGEEAYAVGHPIGYSGSLTSGVISGLDRTIEGADGSKLSGLIQFDAAVNPGNSGGPLLNRAGQVIGIVTALANPSRDGYFIGLGFAVPIGAAGGAANAPPK